MEDNTSKTALGLPENIEAVLCYVLGWITGIIFLLLEKENKFIRFHALQSIVSFVSLFVLSVILGFIPIVNLVASIIMGPLSLILWLILMYKAYKGEKYKLPWIGDWCERQLGE